MTPEPKQYIINGTAILAYDDPGSRTADWVADEIFRGCYGLDQIGLAEGDIVVDIGAHIGLVSIYLAKRNPSITIFAFEPFPMNFDNCQRNIELNHVGNIHLSNTAITCDGRDLTFVVDPTNSGSATAMSETLRAYGTVYPVHSTTLDDVFARHRIERCKLLKIDCEGLEYEILYNTQTLDRIDYLCGEFHENEFLRSQGHIPVSLFSYCLRYISNTRAYIDSNYIYD